MSLVCAYHEEVGATRSQSNGDCQLFASQESENPYFRVDGVLEHKTGEFWLAHLVRDAVPALPQPCLRAQFSVDVEGKVTRMGLDLRAFEEDQDSPLVWFDRV